MAYLSIISMIAPISPQLEMVKKIESEHISKIIDLDAQRLKHEEEMDKRLFENAQKIRQHELIYAIVLGIFVLILVFTLKDSPVLLLDFMKIAFGAIGGLEFGYYKGKKDSTSDE